MAVISYVAVRMSKQEILFLSQRHKGIKKWNIHKTVMRFFFQRKPGEYGKYTIWHIVRRLPII
jgi:hypothetical protein